MELLTSSTCGWANPMTAGRSPWTIREDAPEDVVGHGENGGEGERPAGAEDGVIRDEHQLSAPEKTGTIRWKD